MMKSIGLSLRLTEDRDDGVHLEAALLASAAAAAAFGSSGLYDKFGYIQCIFVTLQSLEEQRAVNVSKFKAIPSNYVVTDQHTQISENESVFQERNDISVAPL